jgi:hypothetical protein
MKGVISSVILSFFVFNILFRYSQEVALEQARDDILLAYILLDMGMSNLKSSSFQKSDLSKRIDFFSRPMAPIPPESPTCITAHCGDTGFQKANKAGMKGNNKAAEDADEEDDEEEEDEDETSSTSSKTTPNGVVVEKLPVIDKMSLTPEELEKLKRERNRIHAKMTRNRKRELIAGLEQRVFQLEESNRKRREMICCALNDNLPSHTISSVAGRLGIVN